MSAPCPSFGSYAAAAPTLSALAAQPVPGFPWIAVRQRFEQFHGNLRLTRAQFQDGRTKGEGIVGCLNRHYYDSPSGTDNSFFVGSWGKDTATRPPRDVDVFFVLPAEVYHRFQDHIWKRQSALLQEVKGVLAKTYPNTTMRGDGQVVMVGFGSYNVEVVPAFELTNGSYWICDTNDGGRYKETNPWAEAAHIDNSDKANNLNLRPLIRMLKAWQAECAVPIKSFQIELIAADFLQQSPWRLHDLFWFDWISRDFFVYLYQRANTFVTIPGTNERIFLGNDWQSRTASADHRAVKACDFEYAFGARQKCPGSAWQK